MRAARDTRAHVAAARPHAVVADILTLGPALAGELEDVPVATLIPHVHPAPAPRAPPVLVRRAAAAHRARAARCGAATRPARDARARARPRATSTSARGRLGLAPLERVHGGISERLCLVGTFPQLEYPREWPDWTHVVGPLLWEPPVRGCRAAARATSRSC